MVDVVIALARSEAIAMAKAVASLASKVFGFLVCLM